MCSLAPFHMTSLVMDLCSRSLKTRPPVKDFLQMNVRCVFGEILESISFSVPASLLWRDPIYRLQLCLDSLWEPLLITSVQPVSVSWDGGKVVLIAHGSSDGQMLPWSGLPLQRGILLQGVEASIIFCWVVKWKWHLSVTRLSTCWDTVRLLAVYMRSFSGTGGLALGQLQKWLIQICKLFRYFSLRDQGFRRSLLLIGDGGTGIVKSFERAGALKVFCYEKNLHQYVSISKIIVDLLLIMIPILIRKSSSWPTHGHKVGRQSPAVLCGSSVLPDASVRPWGLPDVRSPRKLLPPAGVLSAAVMKENYQYRSFPILT